MENLISKPVETIKRIVSSKKFLCIVIFLSVQCLFALISAFKVSTGLDDIVKLIEQILATDLSMLEEGVQVLDKIMKVASLIGVLPLALICCGFWFIFVGAKKNKKYMSIGVLLLKIYAIWNVVTFALTALGSLIGFIALLVILSKINSALLAIGFFVLVFIVAYFLIIYLYLYKLIRMIYGIEDTIKTGKNLLYVFTFSIVWFWINGIISILGSFTGGFLEIVENIFGGLVSIFLALMFSEYKRENGLPDLNEINEINKSRRNKGFVLQVENGYVSEFPEATFHALKNDNGFNKAQENTVIHNQFTQSNQQIPNTVQKAINTSLHGAQDIQINNESLQIPADINDELSTRVLEIFTHGEMIDARYTCIGERNIIEETKCPIKVCKMQLYKDSISEKKVLRIVCDNISNVNIIGLAIKVIPHGNYNNKLGIINKAIYKFAPVENGKTFLGEFGLPLPEDTTNGEIIICSIDFFDGFTWDKGSEPLVFTSKEKFDFDMDLYSKLY